MMPQKTGNRGEKGGASSMRTTIWTLSHVSTLSTIKFKTTSLPRRLLLAHSPTFSTFSPQLESHSTNLRRLPPTAQVSTTIPFTHISASSSHPLASMNHPPPEPFFIQTPIFQDPKSDSSNFFTLMCKSKMATDAAEPNPPSRSPRTTPRSTEPPPRTPRSRRTSSSASAGSAQRPHFLPSTSDPSTSNVTSAPYTSGSSYKNSSSTASASASTRTSLSTLRDSLPETAHIYDFTEISAATNNFLAKKYSSSSTASWRCNLRGKDVIVFQRKFRRSMETAQLRERLSVICRSHHISIIKLLGASISGDHIYLVYDFINGANLANCLRNPKNPNFTVLSTWISRMQVATDLAHGLDYIHNQTGQNIGIVHNHIKSSSIVVTEPSFNAKICHFGTAQLCGETDENVPLKPSVSRDKGEITEIVEEEPSRSSSKKPELRRSDSRRMQFEGVRGYMSPEFQSTGIATQKTDVYAFGVVILELLSGEEPLKYKFDKESGDFRRTSVIETARGAIEGGGGGGDGGGGGGGEEMGRDGRLRRWIDRRLNDSFPVEVAERVIRVVLECVHVDPDQRPGMGRVAGKISKLYLESRKWSDRIKVPTGISVSLAPR